MRLAGKVALISGGARGMGAAETRFFAREGAGVVIGDIFENEGREVAQRAVDFLHSRPARQAATLQPALDTAEGAP